jgi:colanic acid biosynthesis protein WcaH
MIRVEDGVVLGKRTNDPLKGEWFVPGGTVFKNERLREAVHRVGIEELGTDVTIREKLGSFEHFYDSAEAEGTDTKHYLATCFVVTPDHVEFTPDKQHTELRVFRQPFPEFHPYIERYLDEMGLLEREPGLEEDYR